MLGIDPSGMCPGQPLDPPGRNSLPGAPLRAASLPDPCARPGLGAGHQRFHQLELLLWDGLGAGMAAGSVCFPPISSKFQAGIWALSAHVQVQKQLRSISVPMKILHHLVYPWSSPFTPLVLLLCCSPQFLCSGSPVPADVWDPFLSRSTVGLGVSVPGRDPGFPAAGTTT